MENEVVIFLKIEGDFKLVKDMDFIKNLIKSSVNMTRCRIGNYEGYLEQHETDLDTPTGTPIFNFTLRLP